MGSRRYQGNMVGKADRDNITVGRQTRWYLKKPYAVLSVPARTARDTSLLLQTGPCSHSIGEDAVNGDNHTVRLYICESEQH